MLKRSDEFTAEEYGLWVYLLRASDPTIQQLVQQAEQSPNDSNLIPLIRKAMDSRLDNIFKA